MTAELWALLITSVVGLITSVTAFIKSRMTDSARAETKAERDRTELELRDLCRQNSWEVARMKEDLAFLKATSDDHQLQLSTLNTELAKLGTKLDNAIGLLQELKNK